VLWSAVKKARRTARLFLFIPFFLMENLKASEVETPSVTIEPIVSPSTPDSSNQEIANLREKTNWKGYVRTAVFTVLATVGAAGAYKVAQSSGHNAHHADTAASENDSHADNKNSPLNTEKNLLTLDSLKGEAEKALTLATFAKRDGDIATLSKCLAAMERWQQAEIAMNGEPQFRNDNGLVPKRISADETLKQDLWERTTNAINDLKKNLSDETVSSTETEQESSEG